MNNLKKNIIKAVSIVMIAVITVMTPLSDYADTQGIGETHAVAPTVITIAKLFGAIAGAYGIYVASDKLAEEAQNWEVWTQANDSDAYNSISDIKTGLVEYVITRQLAKSVANYLGSKASESVEILAYGKASAYNTLPNTSYTSSFLDYYENNLTYTYPMFIQYTDDPSYGPVYTVYCSTSSIVYDALNNDEVSDICYSLKVGSEGQYSEPIISFHAFDANGLPVAYDRSGSGSYSRVYMHQFRYDANRGWTLYWEGDCNSLSMAETFDNGYVKTINPFYRVYLNDVENIDLQTLVDNSRVLQSYTVDYAYRGEKAVANESVLVGAAVTEPQLDEINNVIEESAEEANNNIIQFPGNYPGNDAYKALSNAISIAVANALIQAGIGNNSGEDSGSDSEGSAEQVGLLRQILNALTDSNPIPSLREILELLGKKFGDISIGHNGIINSIAENSPVPTLREINEALGYKLGDIKTSLSTVIDAIAQTSPIQALEQIGENIASLPQQIADNVKLFISELFVPDTTEIEEAVDDLRAKFVFADSMITVVDDFKGILKSSNGPPVIYIDFTESDDERYHSVGRLVAVDFAWYERYKPYGDAILSAIIYAFFIWRMFRLIPNILNGVSSSVEVGSSSPGTLTGTIPTFDNPRIGKG